MNVREIAERMKLASPALASSSLALRNQALLDIADALMAHREDIFAANRKDLAKAKENKISEVIMKRLKFDDAKLEGAVAGIRQLVELPDPIHRVQLDRELDTGLELKRVTVPIGVIGVIFEARPDALVQISTLCIKSGNGAILKGGKETACTNKALFDVIHQAAIAAHLPSESLAQVEAHSEIDELLTCDDYVDLLIPRGSNRFVRYIMDHTKIPVMGHADGVCAMYIDQDADPDKIIPLVIDAKTQYTAACNAVETILIQRTVAKKVLPMLKQAFDQAHVTMHGTKEVNEIIPVALMEDFHKEYLSMDVSLKIVEDVKEAVDHINRYGSHHTDAIITENAETAAYFMDRVDSAGVYQNASTRFADGFRYGFGAEVGISTSKIHARGPVGLEGLVTYKYKLYGHGQTVGDYVNGKKSFHFKDLEA